MKPEDWNRLEMKPPSANHDPFHDYVTLDGRLTDKGRVVQRFAQEMKTVIAERAAKLVASEGINIVNQINAALNDVRTTLVSLTDFAKTPDISDRITAASKARYQLDLTLQMIQEHREKGIDVPWSERKPLVDEEFS